MHNNISDAESFFETASKEELIDYLVKTIEKEVSKGDDADCDLVRECSDWLDELIEDEVTFTPEELERKLAQLKAGSELNKPVKIRKKAKLKTFVRVALIAAVIFAISLVSLSSVAVNKWYGSAWEYVSENISTILGMRIGEKTDEQGITIIKNTGSVLYDNIEMFLESEKIDIMYPSCLPNNLRINSVYYVEENNNCYSLILLMDNEICKIYIRNYYYTDESILESLNCVIFDDVKYHITQKDECYYHAICQYNGFEYIIQCDNYDELLFIISNMKG